MEDEAICELVQALSDRYVQAPIFLIKLVFRSRDILVVSRVFAETVGATSCESFL